MKNIFLTTLFSISLLSVFGQYAPTPALDSLRYETDPKVLQKKIDILTQSRDEDDWLTVINYFVITNQQIRKEALNKDFIKRFPTGKHAIFLAIVNLRGKNGDAMEHEFEVMKTTFPTMTTDDNDEVENMIAVRYVEERNTVKSLKHLSQVKTDPDILTIAYKLLDYDASAAEKLAKQALEQSRLLLADSAGKVQDKTLYEKIKTNYYQYLSLCSKIEIKLNKNDEALKFSKEAYLNRSNNDPNDGIASYGYLLSSSGRYQEAFPILKQSFIEGKSNEAIRTQLRIAYQNLNPGKDGNKYLMDVQDSVKRTLEKDLANTIQNVPAPNFYVTDSSGKTVSLADFRGKVIVLDFWATWCLPCKLSLPFIQLTANRYKDDPNVKFLIIHTWEANNNPLENAKKYLSDNGYNLPLYMDLKDPKSKVNPAVSAFGILQIPAKFVIDGKGNIRFRTNGFESSPGNEEGNLNELSAMIELAKKST